MIRNYLSFCLFGISVCFLPGNVAREAVINGFLVDTNLFTIFRFQVSVQIHDYGHVCGGGIVDNRFVLTAAHCILNRTRHLRNKYISVLAGTISLNETGPPAVRVQVEKVFFPKEFHPAVAFSHGDIAVLRLMDSLELKDYDHLKKFVSSHTYNPTSIGMIGGFGWNHYHRVGNVGIGSTDGRLRFIVLSILSDEECEKHYPRGAIQTDIHLCALPNIGAEHDVCTGDSGSPIVQNGSIIGILSRIPDECNGLRPPSIYTRVVHYSRMILNAMYYNHDPDMISLHT